MAEKEDRVSEFITHHRKELGTFKLREKMLAEFTGTFYLTFTVGTAAVSTPLAPVAIGLVLAVQIYTFGAVSGGFFNPAVTISVLLSGRRKILPHCAAYYVLVELLGGVAGAFAALLASGKTFCFDHALTQGLFTSVELEVLMTTALCGSVLATGTSTDAPNDYFGLAIGMTVAGAALAGAGFNQGSFNPAVTLGVNLANYANAEAETAPSSAAWAVFVLAPLLGAALAALAFRLVRGGEYRADEGQATDAGVPLQSNPQCSNDAARAPAEAAPRAAEQKAPVEEQTDDNMEAEPEPETLQEPFKAKVLYVQSQHVEL